MIDRFQYYVKSQEELKHLKLKWQQFVMRDKYAIPGDDCHLMRWDTPRAISDAQEIPEYKALLDRLLDLIKADFPVKHEFCAKGVELSPAGHKMWPSNVSVDVADGGISTAVAAAKEQGKMLVSKNVFCQLTPEQREECAQVSGVHQYATGATGRVTVNNPTGYWVTGFGDVGKTVDIMAGVKRTYTFAPITLFFSLMQIVIPSMHFSVGAKLREVYGLTPGRYTINTDGVNRVGDCVGAGDDEKHVRSVLDSFKLRCKKGQHGFDHTVYGECSRKIDGIFCYLTAEMGEAVLQFRNGAKWVGRCSHMIKCAFEMVGDTLYLLYVDEYMGNDFTLNKDLQDYFRSTVSFEVALNMIDKPVRFLTSTKVADNLPYDGIVVWGTLEHYFFKEKNTVDITRCIAEDLANDGVYVPGLDDLIDGKIYEFAVKDEFHLEFVKERDPLSKILPNMPKNVRRTLKDPTLENVRAFHASCRKQEDNQCSICKFI
jgi:hypothetical protein